MASRMSVASLMARTANTRSYRPHCKGSRRNSQQFRRGRRDYIVTRIIAATLLPRPDSGQLTEAKRHDSMVFGPFAHRYKEFRCLKTTLQESLHGHCA